MKQQEYFGAGSLENLPNILLLLNTKNIFLVRGNDSYVSSGAEKIFNEMLKNYSVTFFSEFRGNPKLEEIIKGMDCMIESGCDTVIAAGGGSAIDIAKSINILSSQEDHPKSIIESKAKIFNKGKPLIAIPTTSGSGSESTHFAVVYIGKEKFSVAHEFILPEYSITDPQLTYNLPSNITATSGIDAFSQAVESYWSVSSNAESKNYSSEAITLILSNLESAVNNPTKESRFNMSRAAHLAGKAINITKTTAPHAISYSLTSYFGIPHGQAVSITLGEFLEYNFNISDDDLNGIKSAEEVRKDINDLMKLFGCKDIAESKSKIKKLLKNIGLKTKLSELNINSEEHLLIIAGNVNLERLRNNPRSVSKENLDRILNNVL